MPFAAPKQISVASLWAEDVPAAVRFYGEVIGLKLCTCQGYHMDPPHFEVGGAYLVILKGRTALAQGSQAFPVVALAVDDLDSAVERLTARGVDSPGDIEEDAASRWVFFRDPAGNLIELAYWK